MERTAALSRDTLIDEAKGRSTADVVWWTVAAAVFLIPLVVDPLGKDLFRIPKELLFRFFAIVVAALLATNWTFRKNVARSGKFLLKSVWSLSLAIAGWTIVTTMTSTNVTLSVESLITVLCGVAFFLGARVAVRRHPSMRSFDVVLPAAIINAMLAMSQEFAVWQPFEFLREYKGHISTTALLGNPNDAGMYLLAPALACVVATGSSAGTRRTVYLIVSALLLGGLIACGTRAALLAWAMGLMIAAAKWTGRRAFLWVTIALVLGLAVSYSPLRDRFIRFVAGARAGRSDIFFSERLTAYLTAFEMSRDHPVTGVGPGAFKGNYLKYRVRIAEKYPEQWTKGAPLMFRETHNDHLQILSETGLPGYALFIVAAVVLAVRARRTDSYSTLAPGLSVAAHPTTAAINQFEAFADRLRLPLAVALVVMMLAQFPLQIAAARVVMLYFFALCTWRNQ